MKYNMFKNGVQCFNSGLVHTSPYSLQRKRYLCSIERDTLAGELPTKPYYSDKIEVQLWWDPETKQVFEVDTGTCVKIRDIGNPLDEIAQTEMTVDELAQSGPHELPPPLKHELEELARKKEKKSIWYVLEYEACELILPLLGIKIIPESDAKHVGFELMDINTVEFYRK